jgi:hypothetical protein
MAEELENLQLALGASGAPALVVIDTFSKFSAGIDENDNAEVAAYLSGLSRGIREQFKCTVLLVAHSGHKDTDRPRGASSLMANPDAEYIIARDGMNVTVTRERFKDSPSLAPLAYEGRVIDLGRLDRRDRPVTSLALIPASGLLGVGTATRRQKLGPQQQRALAEIRTLIEKQPTMPGDGQGANVPKGKKPIAVQVVLWALASGLSCEGKPARAERMVDKLGESGYLGFGAGWLWLV